MEMRRKHRRSSNVDEIAIVKAAAWAWYENGSGADQGKPIREHDLTRTQRNPKPTRYKIEAMKKLVHQQKQEKEKEEEENQILKQMQPSNSNGEKSLLDTYEIERISRELHSYIQSSRIQHLKTIFRGGGDGGANCAAEYGKVVSLLSEKKGNNIDNKNSSKKPPMMNNYNNNNTINRITVKGFWPVICGSRHDDVVVAREAGGRKISFGESSSRRRRQRDEKNSTVALVETSRSHHRRG